MSYPGFYARPPWIGPDLQTLRNMLVRPRLPLDAWPGERLMLPLDDGDCLLAMLHRPEGARRPLVAVVHGLTGCEDSFHVRATALHLLRHGWPVLRLNLRGAGPSRPHCRGQYHAGRGGDLAEALAGLARLRPEVLAEGVAMVGFSLGGSLLLNHLADARAATPLRAAVSISAPLDLAAAQRRMGGLRNRPYQGYLLRRMKAESLATPGGLPPPFAAAARAAADIYAFDDVVVAPINGFDGAEDYYRRASAGPRLAAIAVPTLLIHAADDPWIPSAGYDAVAAAGNPRLALLQPTTGGHVGFHGRGTSVPWHDRCLLTFLEECLAVQPDLRRRAASTAK